ncbi:MAG: glycosyltransferase family 2 protein [bacterium]|nr:glycosyltransferase family 2 protein [bacterium]
MNPGSPPESAAPRLSLIVPVYRGRQTIEELARRLIAVLDAAGSTFELLFVDDGSSDGSWDCIRELARSEARIRGIRLTRNFGQHNATLCGFRHARGELLVTLDEDLQNPPEELPKLLEAFEERDADVLYGIPHERQSSLWRRLASRVVMFVPRKVMGIDFDISAYRVVRRSIALEVTRALRHDIIIDVYFAWITDRIASIKVQHVDPSRGSSYTMWKLVRVLFNLVCNYTVLPLRLAVVTGLGLSLVSLVLGAVYVYLRFTQDVVPGFSALIVSVLFSTGVILLGVGAVSEYLARTFLHVIRKPQSVVRETTDRAD